MDEYAWKKRFVVRLSALFRHIGVEDDDAHADAEVHAHDRYPQRSDSTPEQEADAVFRSLGDA